MIIRKQMHKMDLEETPINIENMPSQESPILKTKATHKNTLQNSSPSLNNAKILVQDPEIPSNKVILVAGKIPVSVWFIMCVEFCERFSFYGASLMFIPYLKDRLHLSTINATAINRGFVFIAYLSTILGGGLSDIKLRKYNTILLFSILYAVGLLILSLSASQASISNGFGLPLFMVSTLGFIAFGTGAIKANSSPFAAEQVKRSAVHQEVTSPHNSQVQTTCVDYDLTVERIFRFFFWAINLGGLIGQTVCPILFHKLSSASMTFGLPFGVFVIGITLFIIGKPRYTSTPIKNENPVKKAYGCIVCALKNKYASPSKRICSPLAEPATGKHWLNKACVESGRYDAQYIGSLKKTLSACKVFVFYIVYWTLHINMSDSLIVQGQRMRKPGWLPGAEQLNLVNSLCLILFTPVFDFWVLPLLRRRFSLRLGPIVRITIGFALCTIAFTYTTILQKRIYESKPYFNFNNEDSFENMDNGQYIKQKGIDTRFNNIHLSYQIFTYGLLAISEIFASATGLEYAYKFATEELKGATMSLFLLTVCGGSLVGLMLAQLNHDPSYFILFCSQSLVMGLTTVVFFLAFRKQDNTESQ